MSELQDQATFDSVDEVETEVIDSDLAPDMPETEEENIETETAEEPKGMVDGVEVEGPEGFRKAINKKHFQIKERERELEAARKRIEELEANFQPEVKGPVEVPPLPDNWEDDYEVKISQREEAIRQNAHFQAMQSINQKEEAKRQQQLEAERAKYVESISDNFSRNVKKIGLNEEKVEKAAYKLAQYGADAETADFLLSDAEGPLLVAYFAADLESFDEFMSLTPMQRGLRVSEYKQKAGVLRPKQTNAPDPAPSLGGKTPSRERGPDGATYE